MTKLYVTVTVTLLLLLLHSTRLCWWWFEFSAIIIIIVMTMRIKKNRCDLRCLLCGVVCDFSVYFLTFQTILNWFIVSHLSSRLFFCFVLLWLFAGVWFDCLILPSRLNISSLSNLFFFASLIHTPSSHNLKLGLVLTFSLFQSLTRTLLLKMSTLLSLPSSALFSFWYSGFYYFFFLFYFLCLAFLF